MMTEMEKQLTKIIEDLSHQNSEQSNIIKQLQEQIKQLQESVNYLTLELSSQMQHLIEKDFMRCLPS